MVSIQPVLNLHLLRYSLLLIWRYRLQTNALIEFGEFFRIPIFNGNGNKKERVEWMKEGRQNKLFFNWNFKTRTCRRLIRWSLDRIRIHCLQWVTWFEFDSRSIHQKIGRQRLIRIELGSITNLHFCNPY